VRCLVIAAFSDTFTLAGLGALCAGVGSLITAIVGMQMSRKKGKEEAIHEMGGDGDEHGAGGDSGSASGDGAEQ